LDGVSGGVFFGGRDSKDRQEPVSKVFIDHTLMTEDDFTRRSKKPVKHQHALLRPHLFGHSRKPANVNRQERNVFQLPDNGLAAFRTVKFPAIKFKGV
jgi:hypothetical protein